MPKTTNNAKSAATRYREKKEATGDHLGWAEGLQRETARRPSPKAEPRAARARARQQHGLATLMEAEANRGSFQEPEPVKDLRHSAFISTNAEAKLPRANPKRGARNELRRRRNERRRAVWDKAVADGQATAEEAARMCGDDRDMINADTSAPRSAPPALESSSSSGAAAPPRALVSAPPAAPVPEDELSNSLTEIRSDSEGEEACNCPPVHVPSSTNCPQCGTSAPILDWVAAETDKECADCGVVLDCPHWLCSGCDEGFHDGECQSPHMHGPRCPLRATVMTPHSLECAAPGAPSQGPMVFTLVDEDIHFIEESDSDEGQDGPDTRYEEVTLGPRVTGEGDGVIPVSP